MRIAPRNLFPIMSALIFGVMAAICLEHVLSLPSAFDAYMQSHESISDTLLSWGVQGMAWTLRGAALAGVLIFGAAAFAAFAARPRALQLVRAACIAQYLLMAVVFLLVMQFTAHFSDVSLKETGFYLQDVDIFYWRFDLLWAPVLLTLLTMWLHVLSFRGRTIAFYTGTMPADAPGDRWLENLRTHGDQPRFRKSMYASTTMVAAFFIVPILLDMVGCVENYLVPKGTGNPVVSLVQMVKPKKQEKKKKLIANPNTAIDFRQPDLDDSEVLDQVVEATELTQTADPTRVGKIGQGGPGKGGWPEGSDKATFRFIRLQYNGPDWDDGMAASSGADKNFLAYFKKATGFRVADHSESHRINLLTKYDKGYAPPFVFMTGSGRISISRSEMKVLKEYLLDGGMLFADCGGAQWDREFRSFIRALFPGEPLLDIADDDPIFQYPNTFPDGAPPLWHHGGNRALGISVKGRWVVFYHPGDINDAWKTGHSGVSSDIAERAYQMGVNIVYYSFTNYLHETRKYRK